MGRPSSIGVNDISSPYPENEPFVSALVKMSRIMSGSAKTIYSSRQSSLLDMCQKAQKIHQELRDLAFDVRERLGFTIGLVSESSELGIKAIMLHICENDAPVAKLDR